jgi:hypothetical protein
MGSSILRNASDSFTSEKTPSYNGANSPQLYLTGAGSTDTRYAYLYFTLPFTRGVNIQSAKFRVWNGAAWAGSVSAAVQRTIASWSVNTIKWTNQPATTGTQVTVTKVSAPLQTMWEFDITAIMQEVSNGAAWYGLRLWVNGTAPGKWVYATQAPNFRPELEVHWSDAPQTPTILNPSAGAAVSVDKPTLSFNFTDLSGDTSILAAEVQIDPAANGVTPAWTTATANPAGFPLDTAQLDLTLTTYPGLAEDATTQWRGRVQDGDGLWSGWSSWASFKRDSFGVLTITNPAASPNDFISDPTPPISWTYAGGGHAQKAYQVVITRPDDPRVIWDSGKITSTSQTVTVANGAIKDITGTFRLSVSVWDEVTRAKEGSRQAFTTVTRDFTYRTSNTVAPVTGFTVDQDRPWPWMILAWDRSTAPDFFNILRDGVVIAASIQPVNLFVSGTHYTYIDTTAAPRVNHTWEVQSAVNGVNSSGNPTQSAMPSPNWSYLMRPDRSEPIALLKRGTEKDPVVDPGLSQMQEMFEPVGGTSPVLVTQYVRGYQGHVTAVLADDILPGVTARQQRDRFKKFINEKGNKMLLYWLDEVMFIVCYNMTYQPRAVGGKKLLYDIEFDFFEVD